METRSTELKFRLTPRERLVIEIKASIEKLSVSEYLRKHALEIK